MATDRPPAASAPYVSFATLHTQAGLGTASPDTVAFSPEERSFRGGADCS
jgi:hypothetical protein